MSLKKDQSYEVDIDVPLDSERRAALENEISKRAETATEPVKYNWNAEDANNLKVTIGPVGLDIHFADLLVKIGVEAPLWARVLVTKEKEEELQNLLVDILGNAGFFKDDA